jgi:two-component system sensor histidine kinase DctS
VDIDCQSALPRVDGDPVMLQQVLLNLTRNAVEAMARTPAEMRRIVIAAHRDEAGVRLSVRDFGEGIPESVAERLFSPFFTTKPEGMGMGLSICRSIAEAHGGRLWFERLDRGIAFHLQLPAAA